MIKKYLPIMLFSFVASIMGMYTYYTLFNPIQKIYIEQEQKAQKVAENKIAFSDRLINQYRSSAPTSFINAAETSREAVVFIRSLKSFNSDPGKKNVYSASTGSGVIITNDGYIVTNNHVIEEANEVEVMLNNHQEFKAAIIGKDPSTDLALLKINKDELPFLNFGNSDSLSVGEWVMAVGNPFRLQSTVTAGIVSAKARNINILENYGVESFIQTDAAVNPGNSGGALVNTRGELIGVNAAIMTYSGKYEGFSFAIPANLVRKVVTDLMEYGTVQRGWLGVTINEITDNYAQRLGLDKVEGVYIAGVLNGGAAEEASLQKGDVILEIDGTKTTRVPGFMELIARHRPGDKVNILFIREGQKKLVEVILKNQMNTTEVVVLRKDPILTQLGIEIRNLESMEKQIHEKGVYVVSVMVNSIIDATNLEPGFIIQRINNIEVENADMVVELLQNTKGEILLEGVYANFPGEFPYRFINP
jgi:Do/DeqQ family serine protease